jgi:hypothetical protein
MPVARKRAVLTTLIERIDVRVDRLNRHRRKVGVHGSLLTRRWPAGSQLRTARRCVGWRQLRQKAQRDLQAINIQETRMRRHNFEAAADDDSLPVMVPRNDKAPVPISSERGRRLRKHLVVALRALRTMKNPEHSVSPLQPEPEGFAARVVRTACSLCKGWCCRNGEDHAFLDEKTLARVRCARPALDVRATLRLYVERVPEVGYKNSCIFHGKQGCTLDRPLRSDVCNSYFCGGLQGYLTGDDVVTPTMIIAGVGDKMRTSPILIP